MKKIYITQQLPLVAKEMLAKHFDVQDNQNGDVSLLKIVKKYSGVLSSVSDKFTREILEKSDMLKVISNCAVGLDNIDIGFAKSRGISVYNTPGVVTNSTADLTFALLLTLIRKITEAQAFVRAGKWASWSPNIFLGEELCGKYFGILGFGRIGQAVAKRALAFGLNVIYFDPFAKETNIPSFDGITSVTFEQLLTQSDYLSIHASLTTETRHIINSSSIALMKKKPIILNIARGPIVNTQDLVAALKSGRVRGAVLDVVDPEPISDKHPLCNFENCIVVPHIGTATKECRHNMAKLAAENLIEYFEKNGE